MTELEEKVLDLRQKKGYNIKDTLKELGIKRKEFDEIVSTLKEMGVYDDKKVEKAMQRKNYKGKPKTKLPDDEKEWFVKCRDELCNRYTNFNATKQFTIPITTTLMRSYKKGFSFKELYNGLIISRSTLEYYQNKPFNSDYNKMCYFMAIVENNVKTSKKREEFNKGSHLGYKKKIEDSELKESLNKNIISKPTKKVDMTSFLD